jgi:hypothetical protein
VKICDPPTRIRRLSRGARFALRPRMKRIALAVTIVLGFARHAVADDCNEHVPTDAAATVPAGCPLAVYVHPNDVATFPTNLVRVLPDGSHVPAFATITTSHELMDVQHDDIDSSCDDHYSTESVDYTIVIATGYTANPGDSLVLGTAASVKLTAAAPCVHAEPVFSCTTSVTSCSSEFDDHCDAGGGSGLATIGAVLAFVVSRRGRARSAAPCR